MSVDRPTGILIGTAGVFYVASELAARGFHAAITFGNAPAVDILAGRADGAVAVSIQVKTTWNAVRTRGRGANKVPHHLEWDIGESTARRSRPDLFLALVDLRKWGDRRPDVFILPSATVHDWFGRVTHGWDQSLARWRYHPNVSTIEPFKNEWGLISDHLQTG
ncbi:MAG: hypothetical protein O3B84_03650 [Chloroflexi bacterium]|nr:hypothetical protein [Chloroflexota bacterium]